MQVRRAMGAAARGVAWAVAAIPLASVAQVAAARFVDPPMTPTMLARVWTHATTEGELHGVAYHPRRWSTDHPAAHAVVASEDARFFLHRGFDWDGICGAVATAREGGPLRGASTISQQVARNLFLWQGRSWVRKGLEVWYTVWLELLLPKERILELYLNVAETGPMTFGFEAGAQRWFDRPADRLTVDQARRIAGILPLPTARTPDGPSASRRAVFIAGHPAPFPGDPGFEAMARAWAETPGPLTCLTTVARAAWTDGPPDAPRLPTRPRSAPRP